MLQSPHPVCCLDLACWPYRLLRVAVADSSFDTETKDEARMNPTYNIYRQLNGNAVAWVDRVNGLDEAEKRVVRLEQASPGNYIIFDVRERTVVRVGNA